MRFCSRSHPPNNAPGAASNYPPQMGGNFLPYQSQNPASEFNALKTSYLLSGGQDPNVLRQMNEAVDEVGGRSVEE